MPVQTRSASIVSTCDMGNDQKPGNETVYPDREFFRFVERWHSKALVLGWLVLNQ